MSAQRVLGQQPTVVRGDEFALPVVRLSATDILLPVECVGRQLVGPVHPIHASVDVVLITGTDLENAGDPVVIRVHSRRLLGLAGFLPFDGALVCDKDVVVAEILCAVH